MDSLENLINSHIELKQIIYHLEKMDGELELVYKERRFRMQPRLYQLIGALQFLTEGPRV